MSFSNGYEKYQNPKYSSKPDQNIKWPILLGILLSSIGIMIGAIIIIILDSESDTESRGVVADSSYDDYYVDDNKKNNHLYEDDISDEENYEDTYDGEYENLEYKSIDDVISNVEDKASAESYQVTMNSTWYFENGKESSDNVYVENSDANKNPVYFDIMRSDTEETIYESPIIPIGEHLDNVTLDTELSAGTYDCVMTYYLLDDEEKNSVVSELHFKLEIVINN